MFNETNLIKMKEKVYSKIEYISHIACGAPYEITHLYSP